MDKDVYDKLCDFCEKTGQMKTVAVERALLMYMESYEQNMREIFGGRKDAGKWKTMLWDWLLQKITK